MNADECRAFTVSDRSAFPEWVGGPAYLFDLLQGNQDLFLEVYTRVFRNTLNQRGRGEFTSRSKDHREGEEGVVTRPLSPTQ